MKSTDFVVARNDLQRCKFIETQLPDAGALPNDALLVKVDRFALTANNITYAMTGDDLKYWQLFPAPEKFGNIPVWGFGEVIASKHPAVAVGERLFGYFPMATHLMIEAADVRKRGLRDAAAHRQGVAPVYNAYARVSGRSGLRRPPGRSSGAAAAFVHAVISGRRSSQRERLLRRARGDALQRLEQDRVRACASAARAGRYQSDRADLGSQCGVRQLAGLL
jgi:hypothetical protein